MDTHTYVHTHINIYTHIYICFPSQLGLQNTPTASLQRRKVLPNEGPGYDTKQSDGEVPVMPELLGIWSTPSLPLLSGPLWPGVVVPT